MKRILALLLVLTLLAPFAMAQDVEYGSLPGETWKFRLEECDFAPFARGEFTGETYREQLDSEYQQVYDTILESPLGLSETDFTAQVPLGFSCAWEATFYRDAEGGVFVDDASIAAMGAYCEEKSAMVAPVLAALLQDEVELSWLNLVEYSLRSDIGYRVLWNGSVGQGELYVNDIIFSLSDEAILEVEETGTLADYRDAMEETLNELDLNPKLSRMEMVDVLHKYVCDNVAYAEGDLNLRKYQTVASAFEGVTVCAGYSKLFKGLCDEYDIPCILVTGESFGMAHMWNYVRMEDGAWYAVDTTWDDQGSWMSDAYFLKGADVFGEEHTAKTNWGEGYPFVYPKLSDTEYVPTVAQGMCGENVGWMYVDGVLKIAGDGNMYSYGGEMPPWIPYQSEIRAVLIGEDITGLGEFAFYGATALEYVSLPASLSVVGYRMFDGCTALESADYAGEDFSTVTVYPGNDALLNALKKSGAIPPVALSTVNGAQIRTKGNMGLRFISTMEKNEDVAEYGMVLIPSADVTEIEDLTIDAVLNGHKVAKVQAKYLYAEDDKSVTFTAVITDIAPKNYRREYTVRAYAILENGDVVYGKSFTSRSVAAVAQAALERDPNLSERDRELFENIVNG